MKVLDLSNYDGIPDMNCFKVSGIEGLIIGCQIPQISSNQIVAAQANNLSVLGTYAFLWDVEDPHTRTKKAIDVALEFNIPIVWLDVENGNNLPSTVSERIQDVKNCIAQIRAAELIPGIYSGYYFWLDYMGNTTEFSDLLLWHSGYYYNNLTIKYLKDQPPPANNYGGWTECAIHQYASDIEVCGRVRDHNIVWTEVENVGMSKEEKEDFELQKRYIDQLQTGIWGKSDEIQTSYPKYNIFEIVAEIDKLKLGDSENIELNDGIYKITKVK